MNKKLEILICPNCGERLFVKSTNLLCSQRHCFDISKEGYANLLLPNMKKSKQPGDDKTMIDARQNFLNCGFYQRLCDKIYEIIQTMPNATILDAGCGTGFYTSNIDSAQFTVVGVDISKHAVKVASKNNKHHSYVVASIFALPIKNSSIDLILNVFAPKPKIEFERVLKHGGMIIEVVPGKNHLREIKSCIYANDTVENKEKYAFENFKLEQTQRLSYSKQFDNSNDLINLLKMTPYWYNGGESVTSLMKRNNVNEITFDFIINVWRKI